MKFQIVEETNKNKGKEFGGRLFRFKSEENGGDGDFYVLATDETSGVVLSSDNSQKKVGEYCSCFYRFSDCNMWEEFFGTIQLTF